MDVRSRENSWHIVCAGDVSRHNPKTVSTHPVVSIASWFWRTIVLLALIVFSPLPLAGQAAPELNELLEQDRAEYGAQLDALSRKCDAKGLSGFAVLIRQRIVAREPQRQYIFLPPAKGIVLTGSAVDEEKTMLVELNTLGEKHAARLLERARVAAEQSRGATGYQLLHEALVANPDHAEIRKMLGYSRDAENGWVKAASEVRISPGRREQEIIGWDRGTYQLIQSAHFTIYSADQQQGVQLALALERTYDVWRQVWFEYWSSNNLLRSWLDGKGTDGASQRKHDVILFRDREQYLADLAEVEGIGISSGYYNETNRISFFYNGDPAPLDTWRHEIVHQLLQENGGSKRSVAELGHAWLIEGIAMYFESMRDQGNVVTLGGFDSLRLQFARLRATRDGFFIPLEQLDAMDRNELQQSADIGAIYSQSAGMCQFLFAGSDEKYRDGFIGFIKQLYQGRARPDALSVATTPLDQLDRQYREFLKVDPSLLANITADDLIEGLALGQSGIHSADLAPLSKCTSLDWLQLSENPVDDSGLEHLATLPQLTELMIDVTAITDKGLETVARIKSLQQLDIASTRVTDNGLKSVAELPSLEMLWLGGTGITDAGLLHLESLVNLRYIDVRQTKVTASGIQRLQQKLPDLKIVN